MAKTKIPNPLARRHLIEKELAAEQALALADAYLEEDRAEEAVVFLGKAEAADRLEELLQQAIEAGNVFLIQQITDVLGKELEPSVWQQVAEHARAAGREAYAETADRQAHRGED